MFRILKKVFLYSYMKNDTLNKFNEGEDYLFKVTGYTEIPGTNESFFILTNPFGGKHLLKAIHYAHYNLKIDQEINCKIDKINCSGKIYLEPENPLYKEGKEYNFEFIKIIDHINSVGENEKAAVVKDQFGEEIICSLPKDCQLSSNIKNLQCKVLRIKKGELFLSVPESKSHINKLKIGEKYWFIVSDIKSLENNVDHYILKDDKENLYSLKKDMYQHYGFQTGQKIECTVTKYNTDGHLKIEPVHPYYTIGEIYSFKYLKTIHEMDPLGNHENVLIVEDIFGVETKVRSQYISSKYQPKEKINCKVDGIRKGKAILSLI